MTNQPVLTSPDQKEVRQHGIPDENRQHRQRGDQASGRAFCHQGPQRANHQEGVHGAEFLPRVVHRVYDHLHNERTSPSFADQKLTRVILPQLALI